jgi:hypothetical protein
MSEGICPLALAVDSFQGNIFDPEALSLLFCLLLKQVGRCYVNPGAGVFDNEHTETGSTQIAGHEIAANVRGDAAHCDGR